MWQDSGSFRAHQRPLLVLGLSSKHHGGGRELAHIDRPGWPSWSHAFLEETRLYYHVRLVLCMKTSRHQVTRETDTRLCHQ